MKKQLFQDLGQRFYEWHNRNKIKFVYGTGGKGLDKEIEHISELIEYVKKKKKSLFEGEI